MAKAGEVIENPVTGESVVFRRTGRETQGELLEFEMRVEPGGRPAAEHVHPEQTEQFTVEHGELRLRRGGEEETIRAGGEATIPPGTPHVWWNSGDEELRVAVEFRPPGRFDEFLESLFALARRGETDEHGMPGLLQVAALMDEYDDVIYPTSPPRALQKPLFALLAPVARLLGYRSNPSYRADRA